MLTYAKKIEKSDCAIRFFARAKNKRLSAPFPRAVRRAKARRRADEFTKAAVLATRTAKSARSSPFSPKATDISTFTGGALRVLRLIPEGKKEMSAGDFVRGRGCAVGDVFENDIVS
jgi:methionyl-tRNA formyltransferase